VANVRIATAVTIWRHEVSFCPSPLNVKAILTDDGQAARGATVDGGGGGYNGDAEGARAGLNAHFCVLFTQFSHDATLGSLKSVYKGCPSCCPTTGSLSRTPRISWNAGSLQQSIISLPETLPTVQGGVVAPGLWASPHLRTATPRQSGYLRVSRNSQCVGQPCAAKRSLAPGSYQILTWRPQNRGRPRRGITASPVAYV
jgi:hypothetical protein